VIEITVDGLCEPVNPGGIATYGFVIRRNGSVIASDAGVVEVEDASNNVAEYTAAIKASEWLVGSDLHDEGAVLKPDSELLINQLGGTYAVQAPRIAPLYRALKSLLGRLGQKRVRVMYKWIPREMNEEADALSRRAYEDFCAAHPAVLERYSKYLATEKQKAFMARLGAPAPLGCSKHTASKLIEERLAEAKKRR
jgi:ribonuclease HI